MVVQKIDEQLATEVGTFLRVKLCAEDVAALYGGRHLQLAVSIPGSEVSFIGTAQVVRVHKVKVILICFTKDYLFNQTII